MDLQNKNYSEVLVAGQFTKSYCDPPICSIALLSAMEETPSEFLTIRSHLYFKLEFTSRGLNNFSKKLPSPGIELTTLTITGSKVECLSK